MDGPAWGRPVRPPPANVAAEQALLGAILANNRAWDHVSEFLRPDHFADPGHATIYELLSRRIETNRLADAITLKDDLERSGRLAEVGGAEYLSQLLSAMIGIVGAREYGRTIRDSWLRRQLIDAGEHIAELAHDSALTADEVMSEALSRILAVPAERPGLVNLTDTITAVLRRADDIRSGAYQPLETGIRTLDDLWGGLWPGLDLFGAPSGHGKTAIGMQIAENVAAGLGAGEHVQVFSLEMPVADLMLR